MTLCQLFLSLVQPHGSQGLQALIKHCATGRQELCPDGVSGRDGFEGGAVPKLGERMTASSSGPHMHQGF